MKNTPPTQPQKPIKDYIPDFLEYLDSEKNLSAATQRSYSHSVKKFTEWLSKNGMKHLKPNNLAAKQINNYKTYLSNYTSQKTNKKLGKSTRHRHLVALRVLLNFFKKQDINNSLNPKVVELPNKGYLNKKEKTRSLNSTEISNLLSAPDTSTTTGLRDRAILEVLFSTGLKAKELVNLNRNSMTSAQSSNRLELKTHMKDDQAFKIQIPEKAATWVRRYVNTREDDSNALFIRYRGPKGSSLRLSKRSLENVTKRYAKEAGINSPDFVTPEKLRNIYAKQLYKKEPPQIEDQIFSHTSINFEQNNLQEACSASSKKKKLSTPLSWNVVEENINKEIDWLKSQITEYSSENNSNTINCDKCLLRKLATLIIAGKIDAIKLGNFALPQDYKQLPKMSTHGKEWHQEVVNVMHKSLTSEGYNVTIEPVLAQGRADLEANPEARNKEKIYVEVGSVSFYKLWYNLSTIQNFNSLIITNKNKAVMLNNHA